MTNEMKLLTALCDALGFDVESVCINKKEVDEYNRKLRDALAKPRVYSHIVDYPVKPIYEYKVTKGVEAETQDEALRQSRIHAAMHKEKL